MSSGGDKDMWSDMKKRVSASFNDTSEMMKGDKHDLTESILSQEARAEADASRFFKDKGNVETTTTTFEELSAQEERGEHTIHREGVAEITKARRESVEAEMRINREENKTVEKARSRRIEEERRSLSGKVSASKDDEVFATKLSKDIREAAAISDRAKSYLLSEPASSVSQKRSATTTLDEVPTKMHDSEAFAALLEKERKEAKVFLAQRDREDEKRKKETTASLEEWKSGIRERVNAARLKSVRERASDSKDGSAKVISSSSSPAIATLGDMLAEHSERLSSRRKALEVTSNLAYLDRIQRVSEATALERKSVEQILADEDRIMQLASETISKVSQVVRTVGARRQQRLAMLRGGRDALPWISRHHRMSATDAGVLSSADRGGRQFRSSRECGMAVFRRAYAFQPSSYVPHRRRHEDVTSYARIRAMCGSMKRELSRRYHPSGQGTKRW